MSQKVYHMQKNVFIFLCLGIMMSCFSGKATENNRWVINSSGGITWFIDDKQLPHHDHIEMSGEQISVVFRYGVNENGEFELNRGFVWPMLRTIPNNTHASLMRRLGWNILDFVTANGRSMANEKVKSITLDGVMTVVSEFEIQRGNLELTRILFPSTVHPALCEKYILRNTGELPVRVEVSETLVTTSTDPSQGVDGQYEIVYHVNGQVGQILQPADSLVFYAVGQAHRANEKSLVIQIEQELSARREFINMLWSHLILETPNDTVNKMFAFAKIRAAESIYKTKGGYMHGPGCESYYAAVWANDQAEYINPFFPFLGYDTGNMSALNSFRHFARFMNDDYKPIPSSIIAEGIDIWHGAGDRGDGAMIAYGAARYALARGDRGEAEELWPLIVWCLEYCRRNINEGGVVASDSDEGEGRFPAGTANLCTSSLYYDALLSAVYLGKNLNKSVAEYERQAKEMKEAIERYFGGTVEGFDTYKYYRENDVLRSWICIPLVMGIHERKDETVKALFSPRLWSENGILTQAGSTTFWDRSTLYALRGIFACGETEKATDFLIFYSNRRLLGEHVPYAIEAWPEGGQRHSSAESGLYCRVLTEGVFGIRPTGLHSFDICPRLPNKWNNMSIRACHAFGQVFDIHVVRKNDKLEVTVNNADGIVLKNEINPGEKLAVTFSK